MTKVKSEPTLKELVDKYANKKRKYVYRDFEAYPVKNGKRASDKVE